MLQYNSSVCPSAILQHSSECSLLCCNTIFCVPPCHATAQLCVLRAMLQYSSVCPSIMLWHRSVCCFVKLQYNPVCPTAMIQHSYVCPFAMLQQTSSVCPSAMLQHSCVCSLLCCNTILLCDPLPYDSTIHLCTPLPYYSTNLECPLPCYSTIFHLCHACNSPPSAACCLLLPVPRPLSTL